MKICLVQLKPEKGNIKSNIENHKKWIEIAIAVEARYIISTNEHLLKTAPNRFNNDLVETIEPCRYIEIRCPD